MACAELTRAALAFDGIADSFDDRFSQWRSVAAQRRAVRRELLDLFEPGTSLIEIGGGTGEDALFLADEGRRVLLTDISPRMVQRARAKFGGRPGLRAEVAAAESLEFGEERFDGAYSNFAALNCVGQLERVARGLARLVRPGGSVALVMFGTVCPGEWIVEGLRGRPRSMVRRLRRGPVAARLGGSEFAVRYFTAREVRSAMAPWFGYGGARGIGVFVPPSAAEPWISRRRHLLCVLEALDGRLSRPLAPLGDHVLYRFVRRPDG